MTSASISSSGYRAGGRRRDRVVAAVPAIVITALILLMLIRLGFVPALTPAGRGALVTMSLPGQGAERSRAVKKAAPRKSGGAPRATTPTPASRVQASPSPVPSLNILHVGHDEMAALDLAMATHHGDKGAGAGAGAGAGTDSASADGATGGGGAGGDQYASVDWYRRPTHAEMSTYLDSAHAREGWGEVVCRTAPRYRVEDCQELGESPGSGIARALREAAWQFQVLPPRKNGDPIIGAKVRIHFDVIEGFRG